MAFVEWHPDIEGLCWFYVYFFRLVTFDYVDIVFKLQFKSIYSEFRFQFFEGIGFSFNNYITYSTSLILAFGNSLYFSRM